MIAKPQPEEYPTYFANYINRIGDVDIIEQLIIQANDTVKLMETLTEDKALYTYAPGKWSIKEVMGHIIDTERIMAYRALRFSRKDATALPGFEQDDYVANSGINERTMSSIIEEFKLLRASNISLFKSFTPSQLLETNTANNRTMSVRALVYIIAGHELHHLAVLKEHYFNF